MHQSDTDFANGDKVLCCLISGHCTWDMIIQQACMYNTGWHKKRPEHSHGVMQQSSRNESAEKHVCNEQTSSNMSRNSRLKHFRISCDTNEIVLHVIKQCLQAVHHLCCRSYAPISVTRQ